MRWQQVGTREFFHSVAIFIPNRCMGGIMVRGCDGQIVIIRAQHPLLPALRGCPTHFEVVRTTKLLKKLIELLQLTS